MWIKMYNITYNTIQNCVIREMIYMREKLIDEIQNIEDDTLLKFLLDLIVSYRKAKKRRPN